MSIVGDYKAVGEGYRKLTDGWLPREEQPPIKDNKAKWDAAKKILNEAYGRVAIDPAFLDRVFRTYNAYLLAWLQSGEYLCPDTGIVLNTAALDQEMGFIERRGGINSACRHRHRYDYCKWMYAAYEGNRTNGDPKPEWDSDPRFCEMFVEFARSLQSAASANSSASAASVNSTTSS